MATDAMAGRGRRTLGDGAELLDDEEEGVEGEEGGGVPGEGAGAFFNDLWAGLVSRPGKGCWLEKCCGLTTPPLRIPPPIGSQREPHFSIFGVNPIDEKPSFL